MKYFLDTNIIIYALKNKYPNIAMHIKEIPSQSIVIPSIVMAEIEYGARKSNDYNTTMSIYKKFTDIFEKVPFDNNASIIYGMLRFEQEKKGKLVDPNDLMIASIVMANEGILITHNVTEFSRIDGIKVEDWA